MMVVSIGFFTSFLECDFCLFSSKQDTCCGQTLVTALISLLLPFAVIAGIIGFSVPLLPNINHSPTHTYPSLGLYLSYHTDLYLVLLNGSFCV